MTTVNLGMPATSGPRLHDAPHTAAVPPRRHSRPLSLGHGDNAVVVGGGAPVSVQSMTTTPTADVDVTLRQIAELTAAGCQIVRVAVPSQDDADIHFQPRYVYAAIEAGCAGVRVNPGNIKRFDDQVKQIAKEAADAHVPIRIGVSAGSLDKRLLAQCMDRYGRVTPEALVESALWECSLFEEDGFTDLKISVKHHDPMTMVRAYRLLAESCDYPLHLGHHRSRSPHAGHRQILGRLRHPARGGHRRHHPRLPCPHPRSRKSKSASASSNPSACANHAWKSGPAPAAAASRSTSTNSSNRSKPPSPTSPTPYASPSWGCVVNGPGEAREADLGVSAGNGKAQIFIRGQVVRTVSEHTIVEALFDQALHLTDPKQ